MGEASQLLVDHTSFEFLVECSGVRRQQLNGAGRGLHDFQGS